MSESTLIESMIEKAVDKLDYQLGKGFITQEEYEEDLDQIQRWADRLYQKIEVLS